MYRALRTGVLVSTLLEILLPEYKVALVLRYFPVSTLLEILPVSDSEALRMIIRFFVSTLLEILPCQDVVLFGGYVVDVGFNPS